MEPSSIFVLQQYSKSWAGPRYWTPDWSLDWLLSLSLKHHLVTTCSHPKYFNCFHSSTDSPISSYPWPSSLTRPETTLCSCIRSICRALHEYFLLETFIHNNQRHRNDAKYISKHLLGVEKKLIKKQIKLESLETQVDQVPKIENHFESLVKVQNDFQLMIWYILHS